MQECQAPRHTALGLGASAQGPRTPWASALLRGQRRLGPWELHRSVVTGDAGSGSEARERPPRQVAFATPSLPREVRGAQRQQARQTQNVAGQPFHRMWQNSVREVKKSRPGGWESATSRLWAMCTGRVYVGTKASAPGENTTDSSGSFSFPPHRLQEKMTV